MYNKVILVGNLTRDVELRYSQNGSAIAKTAIATSRKFTMNGEKKEETCFVDITFFGRSGEVANQYLRKGSKILVEGRLQFEQWVDQQSGQKRSKHSVIVETMQMLDSRGEGGSQGGYNEYSDNGASYGGGYDAPAPKAYNPPPSYSKPAPARMPENNLPEIDINEDEIPF
ncbi:single-stranded DNA-binding protein [Sulfuricurvum sp. IAE1]|jgi:single-strand DNA-binding protein|uniref:single-stranded DNA-binding protein n=1 Tax=Sulfuricurvum sp. IAE1 TaxID=2546102 RepID=UPI001049F546|nr:single-stranded DNA-binding protein [Sulfuricurvum sp. IAE1]MDD3771009.1 single-stranded DNA-binding protein [Sulfuricurvum sp.]MDX9967055.1 single-stranded DNA-binding protein [Sulfuricurvum sp.]TDA64440.1 single-stranded DNA-binding protein [Sulfuricurvum sp. IAE1]